jgi:uncharacterized membrane protein
MSNGYSWLKLAHLLAVIVWVGGSLVMSFLTAAFLRSGNRDATTLFLKEAGFYGPMVVGPSSLLVFFTGLGMAAMARLFGALWVQLGFGGIVLHFILGAGLIRAASIRLQNALAAPAGGEPALRTAGRRLGFLNVVYLLVLVFVVAVMVLKP